MVALTRLTVSVPVKQVSPAVGTVITGEGRVAFHDITRFGLHRLCIEASGKYPDLETWSQMLKGMDLRGHRYTERETCGAFLCYLWIYFKEPE